MNETSHDIDEKNRPHLAEAIRLLSERDRQLRSYQEIAQIVLSSLDIEEILDEFSRRILEAGILRSVMIAVVHHEAHEVVVVRALKLDPDKEYLLEDRDLDPEELGRHLINEHAVLGFRYDLDDENITATVARTGELEILDTPGDPRLDSRFDDSEHGSATGKVAYFTPVKHGDRVVAVVATGSRMGERDRTVERLELMRPLFGLFAIALHNARLYRDLEETNRALRENEQKLVRLERHRALGEMSAGISHNLNNILTGVIGPAQLIQQFSKDPRAHEEAERIVRAGARAQDLVYRLYRSARGDTTDEPESVDVNVIVGEAVQATRPRWRDEAESRGAPIEIRTRLAEGAWALVTPSGLHDILVNLIFNAVDAMGRGGTITIVTARSDDGITLTVTDTGQGMDDETRDHVFEPFFTTKQDVGTGLGLSTVYGTVKGWGGTIDIESEPGQGTTFALWLPGGAAAEQAESATMRETEPDSRRGKILVVDDDETVGGFLLQVMSDQHDAEWVTHPDAALERIRSGGWDVALMDLGLPDMPGDELARQATRIDPTLATILITGWDIEGDDRGDGFDYCLQKPFTDLMVLRSTVREALALHDRRAGG